MCNMVTFMLMVLSCNPTVQFQVEFLCEVFLYNSFRVQFDTAGYLGCEQLIIPQQILHSKSIFGRREPLSDLESLCYS